MDFLPKALIAQGAYRLGYQDALNRQALIAALRAYKSPRSRGRPKATLDPQSPEAWAVRLLDEYPPWKAAMIVRFCFFHLVKGLPPEKAGPRLNGHLPGNEVKAIRAFKARIDRARKSSR
jgi:hypothetical protein